MMPVRTESETTRGLPPPVRAAILAGALGLLAGTVIRFAGAPHRTALRVGGDGAVPSEDDSDVPPARSGSADQEGAPQRADGAPRRPGWYGLLVLLVAMVFAVVSILVYDWLSQWYRPVSLYASTHNLGALGHLTLTSPGAAGPDDGVSWKVQSGLVKRLDVSGPVRGIAAVVLPIPPSRCGQLAARLGGRCDAGGTLSLTSSAGFAWSSPQQVESTSRVTGSAALDIHSSGQASDLGVILSARTSERPSLCFSAPIAPAVLTVSRGSRTFTSHFSGNAVVPCAAGITVLVGAPGSGEPPGFGFAGISALTVVASGPAGDLQGFDGRVDLNPGGTTVLASPTVLSMRAGARRPLVAVLEIGTAGTDVVLRSAAASSVVTDSGQLVPSEWSRQTDILAPLLGGFVTALVVAPLGVSVQVLMDAVKNWPGPNRRRRGRKEVRGGHAR